MVGDLVQKLGKKKGKGGCIVLLQNTTDMVMVVTASSLTKGKSEKSAPMPSSMPALSATEVGFYAPEGQWSFASQSDSSVKTRLTILHGSQHANLERLPPSCPWTADLQQNWKAEIPQIVVTFTMREDAPFGSHSPPSKSTSSASTRSESPNDSSPSSGKTKGKSKTSRESKDSKPSVDIDDKEKETSAKGKKGKKKSKESHAPVQSSPEANNDDHVFTAPSSAAFGIDAEMGDESSDSDDEVGRSPSAWGKKFNVVINRTASQVEPSNDDSSDLMKRASMIMVKGVSRAGGINTNQETAAPASSTGDDDFFKDLDMTRRASSRHLSIPPAERERRLSQIPPAAQSEFEEAIKNLEQGRVQEASADIHAALSQLTELAFKGNVAIATEWCLYGQLTGLLVEMDRLKEEGLFAQRALVARFVGLLALKLENQDHALIGLRMAVNRNLEMENYRTAAQLLQSMVSMPSLTELDKENIPKKQALCGAKNFSEANVPVDAVLDSTSGQFLLHGYSYALCYTTMQLIRDPSHFLCPYCQATFSEKSRPDSRCSFCAHPLSSQN